MIVDGAESADQTSLLNLFRAILLCHKVNLLSTDSRYMEVQHDEIAALEFAKFQGFELLSRANK